MNHRYIERIKQLYPALAIEDWRPNEIGQNNDVLIINQSLVFRFPKYMQGIVDLKRETEILRHIKQHVSLPIPSPQYLSFAPMEPGCVFTGYELIHGSPLWKESFAQLADRTVRQRLAGQLVAFLLELHAFPKERAITELQLSDRDPREEMAELFRRIQTKLFPFMKQEAQSEITHAFETFLHGENRVGIKTTLIHGDFGASNILWNPDTRRIAGIIDFGGSGLGDPAYDLAGLYASYGEAFFAMCIDLYPDGAELAKRVKFYRSTFALQEALHGIENNDAQAFENGMSRYR